MNDHMAAYYPPPPPPSGHHPAYYYDPPPPPTEAPPPYVPQQPPPPPAAFASYGIYAPIATHDQVRTLFVAGLPEDVKPREIYNLFREFPGYESSNLRTASHNSQPFAFATFVDQLSAVAALHALNGMVFDLEKGSTLYIDLAKSNSRSKRLRTDGEWSGSEKRSKGSSAFSRGTSDLGLGSVHLPGMSNSTYDTIGYPSAQSHEHLDSGHANDSALTTSKLSTSSAPPCPTIFVANLGPSCTEQELIQLFSRCPGFLKLKMQSTYGSPVAFVDFQDTNFSTAALNHLQGTILYSSPGGDGIRLEYAKSRMGMRRKAK